MGNYSNPLSFCFDIDLCVDLRHLPLDDKGNFLVLGITYLTRVV